MRGFIASGETWMIPLNKFRDWLKKIREDMTLRLPVRRNGTEGSGPFSPATRRLILKKLFKVEHETGTPLISNEDIAYIQQVWTAEFDARNSALTLAHNAGREVNQVDEFRPTPMQQQILDNLLKDYELSPDLVDKLLDLVTDKYPSLSVYGVKAELTREIQQLISQATLMDQPLDNSHVVSTD